MPVTTLRAAASFDDLLARHARERPQAVALRFDGQAIDYATLAARVEQAAAVLPHNWAVRAGDRVAWLGLNHPDQITLLCALARLGAVLVPLNFRLASAEWDVVLADCTPICVVHDDAWRDAAAALAGRAGIPAHDVAVLATGATVAPATATQPPHADAPALLVYTSGTTGRPRGAMHTQRNLLANMAIAADMQALTPDDVVLTVLPMFHVGGLCIQTLPALHAGATVILHQRFDPGATLRSIAQDRPTLTLQVPATMKALIEHPDWAATDLSGLRAVWAGSSTLPAHLVAAFHARGMPVCNVYGSTETGPCSIGLGPDRAVSHGGLLRLAASWRGGPAGRGDRRRR